MMRLVILWLSVSFSLAIDSPLAFTLPEGFEGLWAGVPSTSILGPFVGNFSFGISRAPNGDYLMDDNLVWSHIASGKFQQRMNHSKTTGISWQRYYIESSGSTSGTLWYCGVLNSFAPWPEPTTNNPRFVAVRFPEQQNRSRSVTFCLAQPTPPWPVLPPESCTGCDCANWTLSLSGPDRMRSELRMGGSRGHSHSLHLLVDFHRVGPAPKLDVDSMPEHGSKFNCSFSPGDRDGKPVLRPGEWPSVSSHIDGAYLRALDILANDSSSLSGCPFRRSFHNGLSLNGGSARMGTCANSEQKDYKHCYVLNTKHQFTLEWTLEDDETMLNVRISARTDSEQNYVAIGFRPLGRSTRMEAIKLGTGRITMFGMKGADIVAGHPGKVHRMYAELFTGPPIYDESLEIYNATTSFVNGVTSLAFKRPVHGGHFAGLMPNVSILSPEADLLWAVGPVIKGKEAGTSDKAIGYHGYSRGLRFVDWTDPEAEMSQFRCSPC